MKALILSCGTGGGHNMAAKAMAQELERRGHTVTLLDPYQLISQRTADRVGNLYIGLVQRSPRMFGFLYLLGNLYRKLPVHSPVYWANGKLAPAMARCLQEHPCDCILMTHMYAAHILDHLRGKIPLPVTLLIATDYTCIPFLEESNCDYYGIPAPDLADEFCGRGIPREKLLPYGIPVRREFFREGRAVPATGGYSRILLAGGEIGAGKITQSLKALEPFLQKRPGCALTVICGKNKRLYQRLRRTYGNHPQIHLIEQTENMAALMRGCDIFLSKPGELSSIPGCEQRNADYFSRRGMSILVRHPKRELLPALLALESGGSRSMIQAQKRFVNGHGAEALCVFLEQAVSNSPGKEPPHRSVS